MRARSHDRRRVTLARIVAAAIALAPLCARADPTPAESALATALFQEGRALLLAGKIDEACAKLAESQRLHAGAGTLLNLATCHEKQGRLATAWSEFSESVGFALRDHRDDRERTARARMAAIEPKLPHVVVLVPDDARVEGLTITLDGVTLAPAAWGGKLPVDPGEHALAASAPGHVGWSTKVTAKEGEVSAAAVPTLEVEAPAPPPAPPPSIEPPPAPPAPPPLAITAQPTAPRAEAPIAERESLSRAGQLAVVARVELDDRLRGAAVALGAGLGLGDHVEAGIVALVGPNAGVEPEASLFVLTGAWKPLVGIGVPIFFKDGARPGGELRAGLAWDPIRAFGARVALGVDYFPNAPAGIDKVAVVPSLGVDLRR